jgi:hypothetical protein
MIKILLGILLLALVSCEQVERTNDTIDSLQKDGLNINATVGGFGEWEMKEVDSVLYFRELTAGVVTQCIVVDTSGQTIYSASWLSIPEQDKIRFIQPTTAQIDECAKT